MATLNQLVVLVILAIKLKVIKGIVKETNDKQEFIKQVRFYECFGFDLIYNEEYLSEAIPPYGELYTTEVEGVMSFFSEILITFMTI